MSLSVWTILVDIITDDYRENAKRRRTSQQLGGNCGKGVGERLYTPMAMQRNIDDERSTGDVGASQLLGRRCVSCNVHAL